LDLQADAAHSFIIHSTFRDAQMNTMTNTADFANDTAITADHGLFISTLLKGMLALLRLSGGVNSVDADLLAERIVLE
jgi:hypothetical protein